MSFIFDSACDKHINNTNRSTRESMEPVPKTFRGWVEAKQHLSLSISLPTHHSISYIPKHDILSPINLVSTPKLFFMFFGGLDPVGDVGSLGLHMGRLW